MKRLLSLLCLVLLMTGILAAVLSPTRLMAKTPSYIAFGDSIARGCDLASPTTQCYPALLAESLGLSLTSYAADGQPSASFLNIVKSLDGTKLLAEATLITISIGGNDLIGDDNIGKVLSLNNTEIDGIYRDLKSNVSTAIGIIRKTNPTATVILQTVYNPYLTGIYSLMGRLLGSLIERLNTVFREVLAERGDFILVDVAKAMNGKSEYFYGDSLIAIHPTAAGHIAIADIIEAEYQKQNKPAETTAATAPPLTGDVNHDGVTDARDLVRLSQYLSDPSVTIHMASADMNRDNACDEKDLILLSKALAGLAP